MSRWIKITPEAQLEKELEGFEFGYYAFEDETYSNL